MSQSLERRIEPDQGARTAGPVEPDSSLSASEREWVDGLVADYRTGSLKISLRPSGSIEIMKTVDSPKSTTHELAAAIQRDPGLTASLLKLANSPMFGRSHAPLGVTEAVVRVGKKQIKGLLLSVMLAARIPKHPLVASMSETTWRHSLVCGKLAGQLAPQIKGIPDAAFVAGLFHDIGVLALLAAIEERQARQPDPRPSREAIVEVLRQLAYELNASVVADWQLQPAVARAVSTHRRGRSPLATLVQICNELCREFGLPLDPPLGVELARHPGLAVIKKQPQDLPSRREVEQLVEEARKL